MSRPSLSLIDSPRIRDWLPLGLVLLFVPHLAVAQSPGAASASPQLQAVALAAEGDRLFKGQSYAEAATLYRQAQALDPSRWQYSWNLARSLEEATDCGLGPLAFLEVLSHPALPAAQQAAGRERLTALQARCASSGPAAPPLATLEGGLGGPEGPGRARNGVSAADSGGRNGWTLAAATAAGIGLVAGGVGVLLSQSNEKAMDTAEEPGALQDAHDRLQLGNGLQLGGFALAGAGALAAGILLLTSGNSTPAGAAATGSAPLRPPAAAPRLTLLAGPGSLGLSICY